QERERRDEEDEPRPPRHAAKPLLHRAEHAAAHQAPLGVARDPFVLADGGALGGNARPVRRGIAHTLRMSARPRRPWGLKIMKPMRIEKTIRSDHFVEM